MRLGSKPPNRHIIIDLSIRAQTSQAENTPFIVPRNALGAFRNCLELINVSVSLALRSLYVANFGIFRAPRAELCFCLHFLPSSRNALRPIA